MIPHVTHHDEADITELEAFRKRTNEEHAKQGVKVTMVALLLKAVGGGAEGASRSSTRRSTATTWSSSATTTSASRPTRRSGLVVPVIRDVDRKGLLEIAGELTELSGRRARASSRARRCAGGTFTISSLGGIGGTGFTPIVNAPEVAILGVTRSAMKPVWDGREFVPRLMLPLSLSYDHRVIDGAAAARFAALPGGRAHRPAEGAALMADVVEVKVPDIGDFADVPVIEVLVVAGRRGGGRGPARHAGVRQGDDGHPGARGPARWPSSRSRSATRSPRAR